MNKKDIIDAVVQQTELPKNKVEAVVSSFLQNIISSLSKGEPVQLIGFGLFYVSTRSARKGRNPQTGAEIDIPETQVAQFKAGSKLKEAVNK